MQSSLSLARLIAILTPVGLIGGALGFQYLGGFAPCEMCYWQRWPHLAAIALALLAIAMRQQPATSRIAVVLAAFAMATSGAIGAFHAGVEYGWWEGLTACATSGPLSGQSMLDNIMAAPLTRCDVAPWTMFGISMAGYNAILSLSGALAILVLALRRRTKDWQ